MTDLHIFLSKNCDKAQVAAAVTALTAAIQPTSADQCNERIFKLVADVLYEQQLIEANKSNFIHSQWPAVRTCKDPFAINTPSVSTLCNRRNAVVKVCKHAAIDTTQWPFQLPSAVSPQQLEYGEDDIPRTASAAEQEAADRSPSLGARPSAINHSVEHSTVVTNAALLSLTEQMEQMALDSQIRIDMHGEQLAALDTLNTAVMDVNDNLKGKSNLLSNNSNEAQVQSLTIERLGESNPKTAKLFERGLISLDQMQDRAFVEAMEKSLTLREQREGTLKSSSARQSSGPTEYTRTVERSKGVYQYRRPHFSTSPYFAE